MIELIVLDYLKEKLSVPVKMKKDSDLKEFVLIKKAGSGQAEFINSAMLIIQSYSTSLYKAALLNKEVKKAMLGDGENEYGIISLNNVSSCKLNSDYEYTDTTTKEERYQAVYDLVYNE